MNDSGQSRGRVELASGYIAIEGPIGVGKTTLARALGRTLDANLLLEAPEDNPFLGDFYSDMRAHALASQLSFLLQRHRQTFDLVRLISGRRACIADFLFEKDRLFACLTLNADELALYDQVALQLARPERPVPDRVVYLRASPDILMRRVYSRGRETERGMKPDYLQRLCKAYADFFDSYTLAPVISIDTTILDPVGDGGAFRQLVEALEEGKTRHIAGNSEKGGS